MQWTITEILAWWGAVLSTIVFVWDIVKWRLAGPKLRLTVRSGFASINIPTYEGKTLIIADIVNSGDRPTTLTSLCFFYYKNLWRRTWNKSEQNQFVPVPNTTTPLPYELKPGAMRHGIVIQTKELEEKARDGFLVCAVFHTHRGQPKKRRVVISDRASG